MIRKYILYYTCLVTVLVTTLSACQYKDFDDYDDTKKKTKFILAFDWDNVDSIPQSMRVAFYPHNLSQFTQGYTIFDVTNRETVIELPAGIYDVTAWNNDTEHVITSRYTKQETAQATSGSYSPHGDTGIPKLLDSLYNGQRVLDYPDYMVHANKSEFALGHKDYTHRLVLIPDSMVVTVEVRLHGIAGLENANNIRGAINNVAGRRFMAFDNLTADTVAVMFDAHPHVEDSTVTAKFWVFGLEPTDLTSLQHKMVFFFWVPGNRIYVPFDVTNNITRARKNDTYIIIESPDLQIDLKDYLTPAGGFNINSDDWEDGEEVILSF